MRRYYLHTRNKVFYAELVNPETGKRLTARSTGKTERDEALLVIAQWLQDGVPVGPMRRTRPISVALGLDSILSSIRKTELNNDDAMTIVNVLRDRGLIDITAVKSGKGSEDFISFLETFWDYKSSPYVHEKLAHGQSIGKRHCYESTNRLRLYWAPAFQNRNLNSITRADLKDFSLSLSDQGLAAGSINKILVVGTTALSWAYREELISSNPTEGLVRFSGQKEKRDVLSPEEAAQVFGIDWKERRAYVGNLLAATTGLRAGEVLAIRRSDIGETILEVRHSWSDYDGLKTPKNGETRRVPLLPEVRSELLALIDENPHDCIDPFVFYSILPNRPMDQKAFIDGLRNAIGIAGIKIENRNIVFHSWRHYYAARMADRMAADQIQRITGHKSRAVFDAYADHVNQENLEAVGKVGAEVFWNILQFPKEA